MVSQLTAKSFKTWVWDVSVRLAHWLMAICFATAYTTGESESWRLWHVYSGNGLLGIVCFRVLWGFVGTHHARFSDFVRPPSHGLRYLKCLFKGQAEHHTGHNPAGGWAVLGLLGLSATSALSGWFVYQGAAADWQEKFHEIAANLTLLLVCIHVLAVILSCVLHRDNLVKTMLVGYKTTSLHSNDRFFTRHKTVCGVVLLLICFAVAIWLLS
jgi:cytochrome b